MRLMSRVLIVACAALLATGSASAQFTMKISHVTINDIGHEWMKAFKAGVESRSGGRLKVEIYPANQLGQLGATIEGVTMGTIEMAMPAVGFLVGLDRRFQVLDAPGIFDGLEHGGRVFADPEVRKRVSTYGASKGIEVVVPAVYVPLTVASQKPIRTVDDFQGQKIRTPGPAPLHIEPFKKLGATPISMSPGEALGALQNRVIDGVATGLTVFTVFKYYDIVKSQTYLPGSFIVTAGIVNRDFLKRIGPELEAIVRDEARKTETIFSTKGPEFVRRSIEVWEKNGGQVIQLSAPEAKKYLNAVTPAVRAILSDKDLQDEYQALLAAAARHRK